MTAKANGPYVFEGSWASAPMTPSDACTTVMAIPRNAIAMRERTLVAISTVSNKATLREAAYRAKLSSLPGPSRPAREKPALTPVLRSVTRAQLQNRFVIVSPFIALLQIRVPHRSCSEGLPDFGFTSGHDSPPWKVLRAMHTSAATVSGYAYFQRHRRARTALQIIGSTP